jgi:molybdopterin-guanine dinucleotide biosynthesis protein MobB
MQRIHIIGRKNHGKTLLVTELIEEFRRRGLRVGTIKHTHHRHELDTPGKDSHRHRLAGAEVVGIVSQAMSAVFVPLDRADDPTACYRAMAPMFATCDLVIVEGDSRTSAPRIEVWRASQGTPPLAVDDPAIAAVVTDDVVDVVPPILSRADIACLADWILERLSRGS